MFRKELYISSTQCSVQHSSHSCFNEPFKAIENPLGIVQILSLLDKGKHHNEFCFHTFNLVRKINNMKLKLLKIIYSASVNVSVLSDRDCFEQFVRAAFFFFSPRKIPCQASQTFDLNLSVHTGTLFICVGLLELMPRKKQLI